MENDELRVEIDRSFKLEPNQQWICDYLDRLNDKRKICPPGVLPSDLIKGALATIFNKDSNPDWMAQSAHSYREILYGLGGKNEKVYFLSLRIRFYSFLNKLGFKRIVINTKTKKENIENILQVLHEQKRAQEIADTLYKTHLAFTKISHHFVKKKSRQEAIKIFRQLGIVVEEKTFPSGRDFYNLIQVFENTLKGSSLDPLKIHEKIDNFIKEDSRDSSYLNLLFSLNYDGKRYFFSKIDNTWLAWLWEERFFDDLKKRSDDPSRFSDRMPELDYLAQIAEKDPNGVTQIIKSIEISERNFNPGVIDRFWWILDTLPVEQLRTLMPKIKNERWVYLMRSFRKTGYEFERIVTKLVEQKDSETILELAQALLLVKSKKEVSEKDGFSRDDPFYVSDLDSSGIFHALANVEEKYLERALQTTTEIMASIIRLSDSDETNIFEYSDSFTLYDVDFFTLEISDKRSFSFREDIKNLAASIKKLVERLLGKNSDNKSEARRLFDYIEKLPSSRSMWRLRLFALSQCPNIFKKELESAFFKVFEVGETYFEIEGGAEYHQTLIRGFKFLDEETKQRYIDNIFTYFGATLKEKKLEEMRNRDGIQILTLIKEWLTPINKMFIKNKFGIDIDRKEFTPEPTITKGRGGSVHPRSPIDVTNLTIDKIITNLKSDYIPEKLTEKYKDDDFLNPRGAEGLGDALKDDARKRLNEYLENINNFFDRESIHPHYLYSILRTVEDLLHKGQELSLDQIDKILGLFNVIREEGEKRPFVRKKESKAGRDWLVDWVGLHTVVADILLLILQSEEQRKEIHNIHKEQSRKLISYLLTIKDSPSSDDEGKEQGELYHVAINSVRGRAYQAFVIFTENDGKVLLDDTKAIFKQVLMDNSLAVRFMIGRYLATFYFRDKEFITKLFPEIFTKDNPDKKDIYLATWEGYVSGTSYEELFIVLKDYYKYAIALDPIDYTQRKYFKGLDETLAIHLALAFVHFNLEINDDLFNDFWKQTNIIRQQEFISFIGRSCLTKDPVDDKWLEENNVKKQKLLNFWNWALGNVKEPEIFSGFGFWINPDKEVLEDVVVVEKMAETLKRSKGEIDWDYGLLKRLSYFAEKNHRKCLEVIRYYLLEENNNLSSFRHRGPLMYHTEIKDALSIIYKNGDQDIQNEVISLVNTLIEKGSSTFWQLKEVFK